jgi:hypothetical protein
MIIYLKGRSDFVRSRSPGVYSGRIPPSENLELDFTAMLVKDWDMIALIPGCENDDIRSLQNSFLILL